MRSGAKYTARKITRPRKPSAHCLITGNATHANVIEPSLLRRTLALQANGRMHVQTSTDSRLEMCRNSSLLTRAAAVKGPYLLRYRAERYVQKNVHIIGGVGGVQAWLVK